jgi:hypothetical protein
MVETEGSMKSGNQIEMTPAQSLKLDWIKDHYTDEWPDVEIKSIATYQPSEGEAPERVCRHLVCRVEVGWRGDESDYRRALRTTAVLLISPRGRVEEAVPKRIYAAA